MAEGRRNSQVSALWDEQGELEGWGGAGLCLEHRVTTLGMAEGQISLGPAGCQALCSAFGINHLERLSPQGEG